MPHFHLHLSNTTIQARDEEGIDAIDLADAREHAIVGIRGFLSHELAGGVLDLRGHIDITDDNDAVVMTVPFSDAVQVVQA